MFKFFIMICCSTALTVFADLPLTAHWDFTKGSINSVDGKWKMKFRGSSEIVTENGDSSLKPGITSGTEPSGIECTVAKPALSPSGAFRIETEISFGEQTSNRTVMFIYDTKNVSYPSKTPSDNAGILFWINRNFKRHDFVLGLCCGTGEKSFNVSGKWLPCKIGKKYLLSVEYDPNGTVTFSVDGQNTVVKTPFEGPLAPGFRKPVIGDRCGSRYCPLEGNIYWLKLYSAPAPAAQSAPKN